MSAYVPQVSPMSRSAIEAEATEMIGRYCPHLLEEPGCFPVLDFFDHYLRENHGLDTGVQQLSDGVEGETWPDGRVIVNEDTYRGAARGNGRDRFTILHEGYHGIKHRRQIRSHLAHRGGLLLHRRSSIPAYLDPEWQANVFASAALMPATMVRLVAASVEPFFRVSKVCTTFGVSGQAAEVRLSSLGYT